MPKFELEGWRHLWQTEGAALRSALHTALEEGVLNKKSYKADALNDLWDWMERWSLAPNAYPEPHPKLQTLTVAALQAGTNKQGYALTSPTLAFIYTFKSPN